MVEASAYRIDRVSDADLAFLAMDRGPVPEQLAVVLVLDGCLSAQACALLLAERVAAVKRLVRTPLGQQRARSGASGAAR